jgi:hypothetical protein
VDRSRHAVDELTEGDGKMDKTLQNKYAAVLLARGMCEVTTTSRKFRKFSRQEGGYYFLGKAGSLRVGKTMTDSIPVSNQFKNDLLAAWQSMG